MDIAIGTTIFFRPVSLYVFFCVRFNIIKLRFVGRRHHAIILLSSHRNRNRRITRLVRSKGLCLGRTNLDRQSTVIHGRNGRLMLDKVISIFIDLIPVSLYINFCTGVNSIKLRFVGRRHQAVSVLTSHRNSNRRITRLVCSKGLCLGSSDLNRQSTVVDRRNSRLILDKVISSFVRLSPIGLYVYLSASLNTSELILFFISIIIGRQVLSSNLIYFTVQRSSNDLVLYGIGACWAQFRINRNTVRDSHNTMLVYQRLASRILNVFDFDADILTSRQFLGVVQMLLIRQYMCLNFHRTLVKRLFLQFIPLA